MNAEIEEACLPSMRQNLASIGSKLYAFLVCVSADIRHVTQRLIILSLAKLSVLAFYCVHYNFTFLYYSLNFKFSDWHRYFTASFPISVKRYPPPSLSGIIVCTLLIVFNDSRISISII